MPTPRHKSIYDETVGITHTYLGPTAERFVDRQVRNHLHKEPNDITAQDISRLIHWIRLAVSLLTDDMHVVQEYVERLERLAHESRPRQSE